MALTPSRMIPLGTQAPAFTLRDVVSGRELSLAELKSDKATVVMFICNHCPYVKHLIDGIVQVANEYTPKGISFIAISSNDVETHPDDSPEKMKVLAETLDFPFPYLYDETQEIAKAYGAECTPDFFVFDKDLSCIYRGQFDESRPGSSAHVTGNDLTTALDCLLNGEVISQDQKPSIGCNIKWK